MTKRSVLLSLLVLPLLVSCARKSNDPVLATVGDRKVTQSDFIAAYAKLSGTERPDPADPAGRERLINDLVNKHLLEIAAYEFQPELDAGQRRRLHRFAESQLLTLLTKVEVQDKSQVPESDIREVWNRSDREIKARHILVEHEAVLHEVEEALAKGVPFEDLISKSTDWRSAEQGGSLGWITAGQMVEPFDRALFKAEIGTVTGPVKTRFGTHFLVVDSVRSVEKPSFEEVKEKVELTLLQQRSLDRQEEFQNELLAEAAPENQTPGILLINEKFYFESANPKSDDPYAILNEPRVLPTFTAEQMAIPVVKFADRPDMTIKDFLEMLNWMAPGIWPKGNGVPEVEDIIRQMLRTKLMRERAMKLGLDKDPEYVTLVKKKENEVRVNTLYYTHITGSITLGEKDYRDYFEKNRSGYKIVERSQQARIETKNEELARKVAEMWKGGRPFAEVEAMAKRQDPNLASVARTFEIPRIDDDPVEQAIYSSDPGTVVGPFLVPAGTYPDGTPREERWVVAQAHEIKPERLMTFDEAREHVIEAARAATAEAALKTYLDEVRAKHPVKINQKLVDAVTPAMLVGADTKTDA